MTRGGRAWRGWFPVGGELTSGRPDRKEGIYFGAELPVRRPACAAPAVPLHGPNLFPERPARLRATVLEFMDAMTALGHVVMRGVAAGLGLDAVVVRAQPHRRPHDLVPHLRLSAETGDDEWGVAEHTDYGLLTMLMQDGTGGLQVHARDGWIDVPADPDAFVCNIGDMLERMTGGAYRSTPHRVRNVGARDRLSFPFFFDPGWDAEVRPIPGFEAPPAAEPVRAVGRRESARAHRNVR